HTAPWKTIKLALQQSQKSGRRKTSDAMSAEVSPDSKCPICLDMFNNISYLDLCLHKFCFRCIQEWSKNKAECPLCKQPFNSIYHSIKSEQDFKKYDLQPLNNGSFGSFGGVRFRYRTTLTGEMINFRRELYRRGVRVRTVRDGGRSRDTTEELRPFIQGRTEHFLHEFISFAKAPFNMEAYDQHAVYDCPAPSSNENSSSNSSVIAISEDEEQSAEFDPPGESMSTLSQSVWDDETPGPSYSTTAEQSRAEHLSGEGNNEECLSSDNDDCVIVGFVRPTFDRTPELVKLSSDSDEDTKEVPRLPQHIRFSSLSPPASQSSDPSGAGRSENVETDRNHRSDSKVRCTSPTFSNHKTSSKSDRKDTEGGFVGNDRSRESHWSKDRDQRRRRRSSSREHRPSSRSQAVSQSSVNTPSKERGYSYLSGRDSYSKRHSRSKRRDNYQNYQSYRHYSQDRNDSGTHYTEKRSYYYSSRNYSDRHSYSRSRSRSRDSRRRGRRRSRSYSSSCSPSAKKKSHNDKPGGKRKYKTRHLEEPSKSTLPKAYREGDTSTSSSKHKKKSKEKHRKKSKERQSKTRRSLSVELVDDKNAEERSKRHHKKKKKHKKKSKRHKSNERTEKHSPTVITIGSDSDSLADDGVAQDSSNNKDNAIDSTTGATLASPS
uniref:E3 ubiquitin-protein ligase Topors n=1 Tax=Scophthalmus maximus TaxID=52904 RepID=A0A8D3E3N7_SCOMX